MAENAKKKQKSVQHHGPEEKTVPSGTLGSTAKVRTLLGAVCFFSGASVMVIELTGIRLLAPVFGNSLYTWTALIGVVLVAFSLGGFLGGWLADRMPRTRVLGALLAGAALMTLIIPPVSHSMAKVVSNLGLVTGPVLLSVLMFTVPGCLLGAVSPFTVRLLAHHSGDTRIGAAAGFVGMMGSLGSFLGTFATGFVLIPRFGVMTIFIVTTVLLLALAAIVFFGFGERPRKEAVVMFSGFLLVGASFFAVARPVPADGTVFDELTYYHWIRVIEAPAGAGAVDRALLLDTTMEGGQRFTIEDGKIIGDGQLTVGYQAYWELAKALGDDLDRALFLGAGAFGMPQHLSRQWPEAVVDVIEIDPEVIRAGRECFQLDAYPKVEAYAVDARRFLNQTEHRYDFIFGDAYNGVRYIPAHLTTMEFFETARDRLSDRGVFMMNVISGLTGERAELFEAIFATVSEVFDHVEVFSTSPYNYRVAHNVIIVAGNRPLDAFFDPAAAEGEGFRRLAGTRVSPTMLQAGRGRVLTDNRNPVEFIVARQLREGGDQ